MNSTKVVRRIFGHASVVAFVAFFGACVDKNGKPDRGDGLDEWLRKQSRAPGQDVGSSTTSTTTASTEEPEPDGPPCTLADNDVACETERDESGLTKCVAGHLQCWVCTPGEKRAGNCGCGIEREDTCGPNGRWLKGGCDSCVDDPAPAPCGFCGERDATTGQCVGGGECMPGWVRFERCDTCPNPEGCSPSSCIGERWECTAACEWQKTSDCEVQPPECDGERDKVERCGVCGDTRVACDGCFWDYPEQCDENQECYPYTTRTVDCFAKGCAEGYQSRITCGNDCRWSAPARCIGCTEGWHTEQRDCVYGKPRCGKETIQYYCTVPSATGSCDVPLGTKGSFSVIEACPPIDCYPGQSRGQNCTLGDGRGGTQTMTCQNDCTWPSDFGACRGSTSSCVPGTVRSQSINCGCGQSYTRTETCNSAGTGWVTNETGRENCPPCMPGDSQELGCTVAGTCGSQTKSCNSQCQWETSSCSQASWACQNGDTRQGSCRGQCGGGTATFVCQGCRWVMSSECYPSSEPECAPGDMRQEACRTDIPGCPLREDFCGSTCQWVEGTCPPCD